ncbi:nuclear transport factor 2 family protein [Kordia sp. YSTF-M3]|uniref:Nuclear transport factor 2 family protein n=1 Tax=Kordia aestuariivivens TaxID=2759037 RepID=A0ABR7QFH0_9FLAO|nr:nuclear transport factor 2 family protein [Kordia aestuariivivens]MBC8757321.1 nuclear transport factor 2 family protein [Kordia aestuariivivens]
MKKLILLLTFVTFVSCNTEKARQKVEEFRLEKSKTAINTVLDAWHKAAADADFNAYFSKMTDAAIFIGTDATENWKNEDFKAFSKPYFDKGKAWSFTALERNVFISEYGDIAWFDELLDTQMELCRGSGVLKKVNDTWKISHYVLSIAIPNDNVKEIVKLKQANDSIVKSQL